MDLNSMTSQNVDSVRDATILQFVFSAFILAFAIMHLLLFIFYPKAKENLFYSIAMLGFAVVIYTGSQIGFAESVNNIVDLAIVNSLAVQAAILFGLLTIYVSTYDKIPRHYIVFVIFSSVFAILTLFMPEREMILNYIFYGYSIIVIVEMIRVVIRSVKKKDAWGWVIGAGFIVAMIFIAYQVLILTGAIEQPLFGIRYVYVYGIVFLAVTVSINLSKKVSDTNKNLEKQLIQVKELSQIALEQERKAREEELSRKLLKADNDRKTKELEEARLLQLSMLPKRLPSVPHLDISVFMKTATEVGGDYYDFKYDDNGNLIIAVGDATGHGMKAGTMVATVKGLFTAEKTDVDIVSFLGKSNTVIKDMQLGNIFMAMLLVKINGNKVVFSSAGMPPALIFRSSTRNIEEIRLQAMPLGGPADFNFREKEVTLSAGDTLLLMSDGFPELFNEQKEILGYDTAKNIFNSAANKEPDKIIEHLCSEADKWRGDADQEDDITFVVVQLKRAAQA
jgi:serine phosphatase RsbU (regulator of sigma subunit)